MRDDFEPQLVTPEQRLWLAVIATFFFDIDKEKITKAEHEFLLREAYSPGTNFICQMAGIDYGYFTKFFRLEIEKKFRKRA